MYIISIEIQLPMKRNVEDTLKGSNDNMYEKFVNHIVIPFIKIECIVGNILRKVKFSI